MKRGRAKPAPAPAPVSKGLMWLVAATCLVVLGLLMVMAREILAELRALGSDGGAQSTRLLTGLFVVMCLAGFTAAALWAAAKKAFAAGDAERKGK